LRTMNLGFDILDQLLIRFSALVRCCREKWEYSDTIHHLFIYFKKAYDSLRGKILYGIRIEFGIPMKQVKPIKMCLNETCGKVCISKHLSDTFPIKLV
jgi:hypothetical protein